MNSSALAGCFAASCSLETGSERLLLPGLDPPDLRGNANEKKKNKKDDITCSVEGVTARVRVVECGVKMG